MKRNSCAIFLFISMSLVVIMIISVLQIQEKAKTIYGPASVKLDFVQKVFISWELLQEENKLFAPVDPAGTDTPFRITLGESSTSVANRLEDAGIIHDSVAFRNFIIYSGLDTQIQAGIYQLNPATSAIQIAYNLQDATPKDVPFAILAGWRIEEIGGSLPKSGLNISADQFIFEARKQDLEGYLLPGLYTIPRDITQKALLNLLKTTFDQAITPEIKAGFQKQGLSVEEAVKLASIVEREAVNDSEKPQIASVFINRLAIGMKLEADPTVQYSLGYNKNQDSWWTNPLSSQDLKFDSPYNTYLYAGLPPGPICNPDIESLRAIAFPAQTPYYFFRASCDQSGRHNFAKTFEEHQENACP
jgi:UPF0755 protein